MVKHKKIIFLAILTIAVLGAGSFAFSSVASAATWYVTTKTCSWVSNKVTTYNPATDACTGGSETAFNTIDNAISASTVLAGDIILVADGIYNTMTQKSTFKTNV